jgi:hypothetical protein
LKCLSLIGSTPNVAVRAIGRERFLQPAHRFQGLAGDVLRKQAPVARGSEAKSQLSQLASCRSDEVDSEVQRLFCQHHLYQEYRAKCPLYALRPTAEHSASHPIWSSYTRRRHIDRGLKTKPVSAMCLARQRQQRAARLRLLRGAFFFTHWSDLWADRRDAIQP